MQNQSFLNANSLLLETLTKACSQNPAAVKEAEACVAQLEIQFGYCNSLMVS
jgi:hypothetical protein